MEKGEETRGGVKMGNTRMVWSWTVFSQGSRGQPDLHTALSPAARLTQRKMKMWVGSLVQKLLGISRRRWEKVNRAWDPAWQGTPGDCTGAPRKARSQDDLRTWRHIQEEPDPRLSLSLGGSLGTEACHPESRGLGSPLHVLGREGLVPGHLEEQWKRDT